MSVVSSATGPSSTRDSVLREARHCSPVEAVEGILEVARRHRTTYARLSDGEPTAGEVIDPHTIREDVKYWNRHRAIEIHTIAVGGNLEVLEWLAKDGGGRHVSIR